MHNDTVDTANAPYAPTPEEEEAVAQYAADENQRHAEATAEAIGKAAHEMILENLLLGGLARREFDPQFVTRGDVVNMLVPPVLVARNIGENDTVSAPAIETAPITIDRHVESTFFLPEIRSDLVPNWPGEFARMFIRSAALSIVESIERDLLAAAGGFTAQTRNIGWTQKSHALTVDHALSTAGAPFCGNCHLILSPDSYESFCGDDRHVMAAVTVHRSPFVKTRAVRSWRDLWRKRTESENIAIALGALGLVTRRMPLPIRGCGAVGAHAEGEDLGLRVILSYQPNALALQVTIDLLYGCGIVRDEWGVRVPTRD